MMTMRTEKSTTGWLLCATLLLCSGRMMAADVPSAILEPYLQVQVALSSDAFAGVSAPAQILAKETAALGADGADVASGARKLAAAKDIATARTAFGEVSTALTAYAEKTKSGLGPGVRVAFCPMVSKPWLTRDKEIRNPYYGAAMLSCGSFKK